MGLPDAEVGTMMLGLVATEQREDAWFALKAGHERSAQ